MSLLKDYGCDFHLSGEDEREWSGTSDNWPSGEPDETLEQEFQPDEVSDLREAVVNAARRRRCCGLARGWKKETGFLSSMEEKSMPSAYQRIIGMGEAAVPFILEDLSENGPADWFWALSVITDDNPITEDVAGDMRAMTEAWLQWG